MPVTRFDEVIGHSAPIERLRRDIAGLSVPTGYLFIGPEGIGKATIARLVGVALLCESEDSSARPCGKCRACGRAERSNHADLHWLTTEKGKRLIRIDQIRALQADLAMKPYEAQWKVAIIDRADALNEAAQNALLKTLEEPPGNTLLILVAPSAQNVLPTIVSRCRIERFGALKQEDLAGFLIKEKGLPENEAFLMAGLAGGSVGRALEMDIAFVKEFRPAFLSGMAKLAVVRDAPKAEDVMALADSMMEAGENGLALTRSWLKDIAAMKLGDPKIVHSDLSDQIASLAGRWKMSEILDRFDATTRALDGFRQNLNKSMIFETLALSLVARG